MGERVVNIADGDLLFRFEGEKMTAFSQGDADGLIEIVTVTLSDHPRLRSIKRKAGGKRSYTCTDRRLSGQIAECLIDEPTMQDYL